MGNLIYPTVPVAKPAATPWPEEDALSIRLDETFARRLDNDFSAGVRTLLHDPQTGLSSLKGEAALEAIAGALPALENLKQRTFAGASNARQQALLAPLMETRLDGAVGTIGRLAERATAEVDDAGVAGRLDGLRQDAALEWRDPSTLRRLGRTAVEELRYQGERRGWDPAETEANIRGGLSDLYAGAVEAAIGQDPAGAADLLAHARDVIDPARLGTIDRRLVRAREDATVRTVGDALAALPLDPGGPPDVGALAARAAEFAPEGAGAEMQARIQGLVDAVHTRLGRAWRRQQGQAGIAALDWWRGNPETSFALLPAPVREWLGPDQVVGLRTLELEGRLRTDADLFEVLDREAVYDPAAFGARDLDRHRLSLDDDDHTRFADIQKAIADGTVDPAFARYRLARIGIDRALQADGVDDQGGEAIGIRADIRTQLEGFETIEGRPPTGDDIAAIVARATGGIVGEDAAGGVSGDETFDPRNVIPVGGPRGGGGAGGGGGARGSQPPRPSSTPGQRPAPGPGHNRPPQEMPPGLPSMIENWRRWRQPAPQSPPQPQPDSAGPAAAANESDEIYRIYREHLKALDPDNVLLKLKPVPGIPIDKSAVEGVQRETHRIVSEKVDAKIKDLRSKSGYEQRSGIRTIGGDVDLRAEFDKLKVAGTRIYVGGGQYGEGREGEMYELPGGIRVGFRMANDIRTGAKHSVPTLDIAIPGGDLVRFHYNPER